MLLVSSSTHAIPAHHSVTRNSGSKCTVAWSCKAHARQVKETKAAKKPLVFLRIVDHRDPVLS